MTGHRSALVLLPQADDVDPTDRAFDLWLEAAGWDADRMEQRPPADHENFGYRLCAVHSCDRVAWGQANQGIGPQEHPPTGCATPTSHDGIIDAGRSPVRSSKHGVGLSVP